MINIFLLAILISEASQAQESPTLTKIKQSGILVLGYRDASFPFSFLDERQRPIGYSLDICYRIADSIKDKLQLPNLQYKLVAVSPSARIPTLVSGVIDLECGSTTNSVERQGQVAFASTTYVAGIRLLSKKVRPIKSLQDLKGRPIISTAGTTALKLLAELPISVNQELNIMVGKDHAESFEAVESDRAVAFMMDDILLHGLVANSKSPDDYVISGEALSIEPYAIMLRKNDFLFKKTVDDAIAGLVSSGEIVSIYNRWFMSPIPPKNINLKLPMSAALKSILTKPTDSSSPGAYR